MHYCLMLVTKDIPTNEEIKEQLTRFNESNLYQTIDEKGETSFISTLTKEEIISKYPFMFDWFEIGGRYGGVIKYEVQEDDYKYCRCNINNVKIKSNFFDKIQRNYHDKLREMCGDEVNECDFVNYLGMADGFIYCDGAKISRIKNIEEIKNDFGACIYDAINDIAYARQVLDGDKFVETKDYQGKAKNIIDNNKDGFLTIIDIHS